MKRRVVMLVVAMAVGSAMGVGAHHSVATVYDESRTMTLEGEIGRFLNYQPHALLHLVVRGGRGRTRAWTVEFDTASKLSSSGVSQAALRSGDRITVCGNPGRDPGAYRLRMLTLRRPSDGLSLRSEQRLTRATCAW
ncbi:MAG: DUF6152 family protein [Vicinamibacteria bacterium]